MCDTAREKVLRAALAMFSRYGIDRVSPMEIAFEAGVNLQQLQDAYPDTDAVVDDVLVFISAYVDHQVPTGGEIEERLACESPADILVRLTNLYSWDDDHTMEQIYRFLCMEQYRDERVAQVAWRHLIQAQAGIVVQALDSMTSLGVIPPCDGRAVAELLNRTALVYSVLYMNGKTDTWDEYQEVVRFIADLAAKGVSMLPLEDLEMRWQTFRLPAHLDLDLGHMSPEQQIMYAALELFSEHGYGAVSLQQIAIQAGVSVDTVHAHYKDQQEIIGDIAQLLGSSYKRLTLESPAFEAVLRSGDRTRMVLSLAGFYPPVRETQILRLYRILFRDQYHSDELGQIFQQSIHHDRALVQHKLDQMIAEGRIPPCDSRMVAICYVHTMCSLTAGAAAFPRSLEGLDQLRLRVVALLVSFVLNGHRTP